MLRANWRSQTNYYFDASTNIYYEPTAQKVKGKPRKTYFKFDFETQQYTEIEGHQGTWGQHSKVRCEGVERSL
eukprot:757009-Hanusia_phi.AAC.1